MKFYFRDLATLVYLTMIKYYLSQGLRRKGPFSLEELTKIDLNVNSLIWIEGSEKWQKAVDINELKPFLKAIPPTRINKMNWQTRGITIRGILSSIMISLCVWFIYGAMTNSFEAVIMHYEDSETLNQSRNFEFDRNFRSKFSHHLFYFGDANYKVDIDQIDYKATLKNIVQDFYSTGGSIAFTAFLLTILILMFPFKELRDYFRQFKIFLSN